MISLGRFSEDREGVRLGSPGAEAACSLGDFCAFMAPILAASLVVTTGGARLLTSWVLSLFLLLLVCPALQAIARSPMNNWRLALVSYSVLTVVGVLLLANYRALYAMDFAPHGDDSEYYLYISRLADNLQTRPLTLYEHVMAYWYSLLSVLIGEPRSSDLLPLNWAFGAIVVVLALDLADQLLGGKCPRVFASLAIIGNSIFLATVVNLYRDGLMLVFYLLAFVAAFRRAYLVAIMAVVCCSMIRMGNAGVALLAVVGIFLSRTRCVRRTPKLVFALCVFSFACILLVDQRLQLGTYFRTIAAASVQQDKTTIVEQALLRGSRFMERGNLTTEDAMAAAYSMGPVRYLLMPPLTLFAPFKFNPVLTRTAVHIRGFKVFHVSGVSCEVLLAWVTIILWTVLGPLLVLGMYRAARGSTDQRVMFMMFFLALMGVSLVSFQGRHRCAFIVFFPTFIGMAGTTHMSRKTELCLGSLGVLFTVGIWGRNFWLLF